MKIIGIFAITIVLLAVASALPSSLEAGPTLQASGDPAVPPLYTLRDKQVPLTGSGYAPTHAYYVWLMGPKDNRTHYSGTSFTSLSNGQIPPGIGLSILANTTYGTYLLSISNSSDADTSQAIGHFGVWGTVKPVYQRTESVTIMGGGLFPGVSFKLSIRNPAGDYVKTATVVSGLRGDFNYTWKTPKNAITETYKVIIDGRGTFDNAQQGYISDSEFTVTQAVLSVKVSQQPNPSYQRTEKAKVSFTLAYPDASSVLNTTLGIRPVALLQNQSTVGFLPISLFDPTNGIWVAEAKIPANATLSSRYRFALPSMSFDDGFGNKGGAVDTLSGYFEVRNASLLITSQLNGTLIQVPFGQISAISRISYPDGSPLTNGTVSVSVSTSISTSQITLTYDPTIAAWRGSYTSAFWDLWRVGEWTLKVQATDASGNSGTATYQVAAQPYLFLVVVAVIVAVVLFVRWTVSRYGRKVYLRIRKIMQKLRSLSTKRIRP